MWTNKKALRLMSMLVVAVVTMTSIAFSQDIMDIAKKGGTWFAGLLSWGVGIGTMFAVAKLAVKQNWIILVITLIGGLGIAYLIGNIDLTQAIIGNTIKGIVG